MKRKKYTEDLDIKITDDEDEPEEDVDVTTTAAVASITGGAAGQLMGEQLKQELQLDGDGLSSMQFFVVSGRSNQVWAVLFCLSHANDSCITHVYMYHRKTPTRKMQQLLTKFCP